MAGFPRSDLDANNWQTVTPDDWSLIDHLKAYSSDARTALGNLGSNLLEGISPFHPDAAKAGAPSLQVPPMLQGIADSYSRLAGTPSKPGNAYDLTGVPELDAPIQGDMSNVLLSLYGGNAVSGFTKPKGALGAGAMRESGQSRPFDYQKPFKDVDGQIIDYFRASRDLLRRTNEDGFDPSLLDNIQQHGIGSEKIDNAISARNEQGESLLNYYSDRASDYSSVADELNDNFQTRYDSTLDLHPNFTNHTTELPDATLTAFEEYARGPTASRKMFNHLDGLDGLMASSISDLKNHYSGLVDPIPGSSDNLLSNYFNTIDQHQANAQRLRDIADETSDYSGFIGAGSDNWAAATERRSNALELIRDKLRDRLSEHDIDALFSDTGKPSLLGSALATAGEQPRTVKAYHSTPAQFDKFDNAFTDELGFHFGSKNQAHNRAYVQSGGNPLEYFFKWRDIPVEMDIKKAAQISGDVGKFDGPRMAQQLVRDGIAPYDLIASVMDAPKASQNGIVRDWLVNNGYDAVKYPNTFEGVGDPSYMALGTGNVRHAKTGQVLYSDGVPVPQNQQSDYDLAELLSRYGVSY